jgi:hypothetical protein
MTQEIRNLVMQLSSSEFNCPKCKRPLSESVGQHHTDGKLMWSRSIFCSHCLDYGLEEDGLHLPPHDIRERLMDEDGIWTFAIHTSSSDERVKSMQILRNALALTISDVSAIRNLLPGKVFSGTKTEMVWLESLFFNAEFEVDVEPPLPGIGGIDLASVWHPDE